MCAATPAPTSTATVWCWPPMWQALRASSTTRPASATTDWRARVAGLGTAPPFVVQRLWLDRPVQADRSAFLGTGGRPPLDNVSVLERYEREAADVGAAAPAAPSSNCTPTRSPDPREGLRGPHARPAARALPGDQGRQHRRRTGAVPRRLPAVRTGRLSPHGRPSRPHIPASHSQATASASTCLSR